MRVRREPLAVDLLAVMQEPFIAKAPLRKSARINAGRRMALDIDEIAAVRVARRMPEMAKADVVKRGGRLKARDMAAKLRGFLVRPQNNRHRVPADGGADHVLDVAIARWALFTFRRDSVAVRRGQRLRHVSAIAACLIDQLFQQVVRACRPLKLEHRLERIKPFPRFNGIMIVQNAHKCPCRLFKWRWACVSTTAPSFKPCVSPSLCPCRLP